MKRLQVIVLFFLPLLTVAQEAYLEPEIELATFDLKELNDSAYRTINVFAYHYDYDSTSHWTETLYQAHFNNEGKIIYEKTIKYESDSAISIFLYDKLNRLSKIIVDDYCRGHYSKRTDEFDDNGNKVYSEYLNDTNGIPSKTYYFYNSKNQLLKIENKKENSLRYLSLYSYNNKDSLIKISRIEIWRNKTDSISFSYVYDDNGRLIQESKEPSPTYIKTFDIDCLTGLRYERKYSYDSLGNKNLEYGMSGAEKLMGLSVAYDGRAYKKVKYNDNGFLIQWYDSKDTLQETHVYNFYHFYESFSDETIHCFRESYDIETKITTYLSGKSKLPDAITYIDNGLNTTTYAFKYYK